MNDQQAFGTACKQLYYLRGRYDHSTVKKTALKFDISRYIKRIQHIYTLIAAE